MSLVRRRQKDRGVRGGGAAAQARSFISGVTDGNKAAMEAAM